MEHRLKIVFYGTPGIAVSSLDGLVQAGYHVAAVVTAPDKPSGRGLQLKGSPVKEYALKHNIPVLQPVKLKDEQFLNAVRSMEPDLQVIVAFRLLPKEVWSLPPLGTFNMHASLLPQYRGAAPINWAIINGEIETGVTTFFLDDNIDTGHIIFSEKTFISPRDTAGDLHDRLMEMGARLVVKTADVIENATVRRISQEQLTGSPESLKHAPKIHKEDCRIDWADEVQKIHNRIRGLSPYPGAFTELLVPSGNMQYLKVYNAFPEIAVPSVTPGQYITDGKSFLKVAGLNGYVFLTEIQIPGKKMLGIGDFLRGFGKVFV